MGALGFRPCLVSWFRDQNSSVLLGRWSLTEGSGKFAGDVNLALFRPTNQSSTFDDEWVAGNAVDGDANTYAGTANEVYSSWWKVRLAYPVWVARMEIINTIYTRE